MYNNYVNVLKVFFYTQGSLKRIKYKVNDSL